MKIVKSIWIFDVDGVITDPQKKTNTQPQILDFIAQKLDSGEPVALNTGRSLTWLTDRILKPLLKKIKDKKVLQNFFASGEKGAAWLIFDKNEMNCYKDESIAITVPLHLQKKIKDFVNSKFSESMFYDDTKATMISIEMKDGYPLEEYARLQEELCNILQKILAQDNLSESLKIDLTTIAIDIQNKRVGKGFAIDRILNWLIKTNIYPQEFIAFGDSFFSDIAMVKKLQSKNKKTKFIFVGKDEVKQSYPFPIIKTKELYEKGTLEGLKAL